MEIREYKVYKFTELSEDAKQKAIQYFREGNDYPWFSECNDSLKGFEKALPIKIRDYSYGEELYRSYIQFEVTDENVGLLKGLRLRTWLINNFWNDLGKGKFYSLPTGSYKSRHSKMTKEVSCPFTGYCADEDLIEPIRRFIEKPDKEITFELLIKMCFHSFAKSVASDIEYQNSDEAIIETIEANDYDWTEDGKID
jgi:hypothetical protein